MKTQQKTIEKGAVNLKEGFSKIKTLTDTLQVGSAVRDSAMHILKRECMHYLPHPVTRH